MSIYSLTDRVCGCARLELRFPASRRGMASRPDQVREAIPAEPLRRWFLRDHPGGYGEPLSGPARPESVIRRIVASQKSTALGMIETLGLVGLIEAADAAVKTANVELLRYESVQNGMVTIILRGPLADVQAAVDAGAVAANRVGQLVAVHVIPRPHDDLDGVLPLH